MNITLPHTIENITGEKLTFLRIVIKDGVEYLETESEVQPNAGPPMHVHYKQDESMTVLSGKNRIPGIKRREKICRSG
jgi:quercetin dioxygenase-like cupin family protein